MAFTTADSFEDFLNNIQQATAQKQAMTGRNMSQQEMKGITDSYLKNKIQRDIMMRRHKLDETMKMMGLIQKFQERKDSKTMQKGKNMADLLSSIPMGLLAAKRAMQPSGQPQPQGAKPGVRPVKKPMDDRDEQLKQMMGQQPIEQEQYPHEYYGGEYGGGYEPGMYYENPAEMYDPGMFQEWY